MVTTTPTYWDIDGESLNTYAYNIATLGGGRSRVPSLRGKNIEVPYRRGNVWLPKIADASDITLTMWVNGMNPDGTVPTEDFRAQFEYNLAMLRRLMWKEREQSVLTKRFYRNGSVISAEALVQFSRGLEPSMNTPAYGRMAVTFEMPDPFFYGEEVVISLDNESVDVEILGDADTNNIIIDIEYETNLLNTSSSLDLALYCSKDAIINVQDKTISGISSNASLTYSGSNEWFMLSPGTNTLNCPDGTATIRYRPAYF